MFRAAIMPAPGKPIEIIELPKPNMEPGSTLLETVASEVCGTDVHLFHGRLEGVPYPIIPGHVSVGRVLETHGDGVDAVGTSFTPGDLVTFYDVHEVCHECWFCLVSNQPNRCPKRKVYGITYSSDDGPLGGWSERIYMKPGVRMLKLPESLSADDVIGGGCGLFTGFGAVERGDVAMGDTVVVQGAGPVGLSAMAFSALRGATHVIMIGDPDARLALCKSLGGDTTLSVNKTTPEERREFILDATGGRGADVVLEASGNPRAVEEGLRIVRDGGVYVIAGHYTDAGPATVNPHIDINRKHVDIRGRWGTDFSHVVRALRVLAKHIARLPFAQIIGGRYGLEDAGQAIRDVEGMRVTKAVIEP